MQQKIFDISKMAGGYYRPNTKREKLGEAL
jgi:hypothetical protein